MNNIKTRQKRDHLCYTILRRAITQGRASKDLDYKIVRKYNLNEIKVLCGELEGVSIKDLEPEGWRLLLY